jgi:RNA polymerase sigma-70 factor (ECF subfamily)
MVMDDSADITGLLREWGGGDPEAFAKLIPLIYNDLRVIARKQLRLERSNHTLAPTALVNELYLQLCRQHSGSWKDRGHFFQFAVMMMRRILTDHARRNLREKRGGSRLRVPLTDELAWLGNSPEEILSLDQALETLKESDPRKAHVTELRVLLGCTSEEAADVLGISKATADREWTLARAWLYREMSRTSRAISKP